MKRQSFLKRLTASGLSALLLLSVALTSAAAVPEEHRGLERFDIKVTPEMLQASGMRGGIDQSYYNYKQTPPRTRNALLPASYDLREHGLSTTVRDQARWGSCWAFGTMGSIESNVLKQTGAEGSTASAEPDYSELHLAWFDFQPITSGSQQGEGMEVVSEDADLLNQGGFYNNSAAVLASWQGVALEEWVPYQNSDGEWNTDEGDWSVSEEWRFDATAHLENVDFLPSPATFEDEKNYTGYQYDENATIAIKNALLENGAVAIGYYADQSHVEGSKDGTYFNYTNWAQYVDEFPGVNHAVTIVGWDDDYAVTNFNEDHQPPAPGAWIVKNSWGDKEGGVNWGVDGSGYFYLSYYDHTISMPSSFEVDLVDNGKFDYDNNYQYDYLGLGSKIPSTQFNSQQRQSSANVFTAQGDELLEAVSVVTTDPGSNVNLEIYKLRDGAQDPRDGICVAYQNEAIEFGGYHTVELTKPITLRAGEKFSVVQTIYGDSGFYVPIELGCNQLFDGNNKKFETVPNVVRQTAVANPGESYVNMNDDLEGGEWIDASALNEMIGGDAQFGNVMLKAFTVNAVLPQADTSILDQVILYAQDAYASGEVDQAIESVKNSFYEAYTRAVEVTASPESQQQVDEAWMDLMKEIHKLGFIAGDKTQLATMIAYANGLDMELYADNAAKQAFLPALIDVTEVRDYGDAMQQDVDDVQQALLDALTGLRFKADKSVLGQVLAAADDVDLSAYTAESVAVFQAAKANAQQAYDNTALSEDDQSQVNDAVKQLSSAIAGLEKAGQNAPDSGAPVQGDAAVNKAASSPKTGEAVPGAFAVTILLAGAVAVCVGRKKR